MIEIKAVSDVQLAFPANVDDYLPAWDTIPEEFKIHNKWDSLFSMLFYGDSRLKDVWMAPKKGVDSALAARHLRCVIGSFAPKHEHKAAGVAYLMSEWFEDWGIGQHENL